MKKKLFTALAVGSISLAVPCILSIEALPMVGGLSALGCFAVHCFSRYILWLDEERERRRLAWRK